MKIKTLLVGSGGYGCVYLEYLLKDDTAFELMGVVDPYAAQGRLYGALCEKGVPVYSSISEFFKVSSAELAVIATPVYLHAQQSLKCLKYGCAVLCEKPATVTLDDWKQMKAASEAYGKPLAIGFQWSYSEGIQTLKSDILSGRYGRLLRAKALAFMPRDNAYYGRTSGWAGLKIGKKGEIIRDSIASNGAAHYLHNLMFLAGSDMCACAELDSLNCEVYRANPIQTFDSCMLRANLKSGVQAYYLVSHATEKNTFEISFELELENGSVIMRNNAEGLVFEGRLSSGETIEYVKDMDTHLTKLMLMEDVIRNGSRPRCDIDTARAHVECIEAIFGLFPEAYVFGDEYHVFNEEEQAHRVPFLAADIKRCYKEWALPSELHMGWAQGIRSIKF